MDRTQKEKYRKDIFECLKMKYCVILESTGLSSNSTYRVMETAKDQGLKIYHYSRKLIKTLEVPTTEFKENYGSLIVFGNDFQKIKNYLCEIRFFEEKFVKPGDVLEHEVLLQKGVTRIKAGPMIGLFEQLCDIKVTKGYIEILKDVVLIAKGTPSLEVSCRILNVLRQKKKVVKVNLVKLINLEEKTSIDSRDLETLVWQKEDFLDQIKSFLRGVFSASKVTYKANLKEKLAGIVKSLSVIKDYK